VSNWREMTWERGWDQGHALGGYVGVVSSLFLCVLRGHDGGIFRITENPVNQRLELSPWETRRPGWNIWDQLESWIGPDQPP